MAVRPADRVDHILAQWAEQRPDLDFRGASLSLRLVLLGKFMEQHASGTFAPFGLQTWEFDVLAALRRQGPPFALNAGELARHLLLTCSGTTHRVNRLEARGLIERVAERADRRRVQVRLTAAGRAVTDRALSRRTRAAGELMACLDSRERALLERLLRRLQGQFEGPAPAPGAPPGR